MALDYETGSSTTSYAKMSNYDKKYQMSEDFQTMKRMAEIQADPARMARAIKYGEDCVAKEEKGLALATKMVGGKK